MTQTLGEYLKQLRGKMSLREASALSHGAVSHTAISQAERGINGKGMPSTPMPETLKEMAKMYHVDPTEMLRLAGYLEPDDLPPNAVPITVAETVQIPVYGEIQAGVAQWAEQNIIGQVKVNPEYAERYGVDNLFALRVEGESMNREIINGDIAIFCKGQHVEVGDIVAVMIDHESATIKRYKETSLAVMFEPSSWDSSFKPYVFLKTGDQDFRIIGKYLYHTSESI